MHFIQKYSALEEIECRNGLQYKFCIFHWHQPVISNNCESHEADGGGGGEEQLIWFETSYKQFVKCCMTGVIAFIHSLIHSWVTLTSFTTNCFFLSLVNCVFIRNVLYVFFSHASHRVFCQPDDLYERQTRHSFYDIWLWQMITLF